MSRLDAALAWVEDHIDYGSWAARSGRSDSGLDLSLDRMRRLVALLGDPHASLAVVHVTGTNGKGSTSTMISRLLIAEGLRVGTYGSPHLAAYNERFRIDGCDIDDAELAAVLERVAAAEAQLGERAMPFELLTAAALCWFATSNVDVAVVEVGVLGRFDATNVVDGRVAVVTNIGFDHTNGEGDWQWRIADEKAGIVKPGAHLVLGPVDDRLVPPFQAQQPAALWRFGDQVAVEHDEPTPAGRHATVRTPWQQVEVDVPLYGAHQSVNASLAITAASAFLGHRLDPARLAAGMAAVTMPARMETIATGPGGPSVILDGAHNPDAAAALARALVDDVVRTGRRTLIIGLLAGRDPSAMLTAVAAAGFDSIITCTPPTSRARPADDVHAAAEALGLAATAIDDVGHALRHATSTAEPGDQIVVTGSIYLVAEARAHLTHSR